MEAKDGRRRLGGNNTGRGGPKRQMKAVVSYFTIPSLNLKARQANIITTLHRMRTKNRFSNSPLRRSQCISTLPTVTDTITDTIPSIHHIRSTTLLVPLPVVEMKPIEFTGKVCGDRENCRKERARKARTAVRHLMELKIPAHMIPRLSVYVPSMPFQDRHSLRFLMACRLGETDIVQKLLLKNRWLAMEFDKVRKTGLHWAARRNHLDIIQELLKAGAFIDARDCIGRTPLFLSSRAGHTPSVRLLLSHKANPFLKASNQQSALSVSKDSVIQQLVTRAMQLHILLKFAEESRRWSVWQQEGLEFFAQTHMSAD